jgi:hypothetical protein
MAAPKVVVERLVDLCVENRFSRIWIRKKEDPYPGRMLSTFFEREWVEEHFIDHVRAFTSNLFREPSEIETVTITQAFNVLADEMGFEELQCYVTAYLRARMPEYLAHSLDELKTVVKTMPPEPVPEFPKEKLQAIESGFREFGLLAEAEYHQSIEEVLADNDKTRAAERIGRLVGVVIKKPFANVQYVTTPSSRTHAYRSWHLKDEADFKSAASANKVQYEFLDRIRVEVKPELNTYQLAQEAQYETGFFGLYAQACGKYICGDKETRKKVEAAFKAYTESKLGVAIKAVTPEGIVGLGGLTLGAYLVEAFPIFGLAGAPVIAGTILIIYTLGVDAFCKWCGGLRTDQLEKH